MAVITITATGYGTELIDGIPQRLRLDTNVPSTVFYTLDGSVPTTSSSVYVEEITMPTNGYVRVRALAISGADTGSLDIEFGPDVSNLRLPWRNEATYGAGIVVDAYDQPNVLTDGYGVDAQGNVIVPLRSSDYELENLDIQYSTTGVNGEGRGTAVRVTLSTPARGRKIVHEASSPNDQNVYFNPRALYIVMDGRDGYEDQVFDGYQIINRPLSGTTNYVTYLDGRMLRNPSPTSTGGLVRTHYSAKKRVSVSYYYDYNETRWIKNIQNFDPSVVPAGLGTRRASGGPLVFKWVYNKRSMI